MPCVPVVYLTQARGISEISIISEIIYYGKAPIGVEMIRRHTVQRRPLGIPCAVREALVPAVRARHNRHTHGIMIQGIMRRIVFVNESAIYATKVAAQEPPLQGRPLCLQLCLLSLICCCYADHFQ